MKVRKKEMKVRKNLSVPPWRFRNPSEEISDFLKGEASELSEGIGAVGAIGRSRTSNGCRDARSSVRCIKARRVTVVGTHDLCVRCIKGNNVRALTGTDAQIVRPYKGLHVLCVRCVKG